MKRMTKGNVSFESNATGVQITAPATAHDGDAADVGTPTSITIPLPALLAFVAEFKREKMQQRVAGLNRAEVLEAALITVTVDGGLAQLEED